MSESIAFIFVWYWSARVGAMAHGVQQPGGFVRLIAFLADTLALFSPVMAVYAGLR